MSWAKITGFYIIFFSGLAAFFLTMFWLFWQTMSETRPKWIGDQSLIGSNPGVGFRPMPDQEENVESTLIWLSEQHEARNRFWIDELEKYFNKNYIEKPSPVQNNCTFANRNTTVPNPCDVEILTYGCNKENNYGYKLPNAGADEPKIQPCVLIKLNKIFDWEPVPYNTSEVMAIAKDRGMPDDLRTKIEQLIVAKDPKVNTTWISCDGESPGDRESIGPMEYWAPGFREQFQGIPNYYFPYSMQEGYKAPYIFVKFSKLQKNVLIQVECKAWAVNIRADRFLRLGSVHFELMLD